MKARIIHINQFFFSYFRVQNDEKSDDDDEEMPELVAFTDSEDKTENEASNPVLELEIAEMKDQIDEEIQKIQALTAKEFIFTENTPSVPSNPMEIPPGLAYLQKYADPYVQDHANEESIDNSSGPLTSNSDFQTLVMLNDYKVGSAEHWFFGKWCSVQNRYHIFTLLGSKTRWSYRKKRWRGVRKFE